MDIVCAKCGEPWDAYGISVNDATTPEEGQKIKKGQGCPACHFGKHCTKCSGTGRISVNRYGDGCATCRGTCIVILRHNIDDRRIPFGWYTGYGKDFRQVYPKDYVVIYQTREDIIALCPDCPKDSYYPCACCDGSGEIPKPTEALEKEFLGALVEATDEDPLKLLCDVTF